MQYNQWKIKKDQLPMKSVIELTQMRDQLRGIYKGDHKT